MIQNLCIGGTTHDRIIPDHQTLSCMLYDYMKNGRQSPAGANEEIIRRKIYSILI